MNRGLWSYDSIGWVMCAALLPPFAVLLAEQGAAGLGRVLAVAATALFWQLIFRLWQNVPFSPTPAVLAVALAILAPQGLSLWQLAVGASFGFVLGELVFGGWGRNVISAPVAALAMLLLSHPGAPPSAAETSMTLAAAASALVLLGAGLLPFAVLVAHVAALIVTAIAFGLSAPALLGAGAVALTAVFLLADPVAAPTTIAARLVYGALAGGLAVLLAGGGVPDARAAVFAALLAQIFAPALDHAALAVQRLRRERRHV